MQASLAKAGSNGFTSPLLLDQVDRTSRRSWLKHALLGAIAGSVFAPRSRSVHAEEGEQEPVGSTMRSLTTRVKSVLEIKGTVLLRDQRSGKKDSTKSASLEGKSTLEYEEFCRVARAPEENHEDLAYQVYKTGDLENQIEKHVTKLNLREDCREVVRRTVGGERTTISLNHPLTASERDLVEGPIATMYLEYFLPTKPIELGDRWKLSPEATAKILNIDAIRDGELQVVLVENEEKVSQLSIQGKLTGTVRDIETRLKIEGKAQIDRQSRILSWLALSIEETREVSEAEPGFQITARIRVLREKIDSMSIGQPIADVEKQIATMDGDTQLTQFNSIAGAYRFVADRHWTTYSDNGIDAMLKLVRGNRTVAHCTITNLADMEPGRQLSMEGFQNDIHKALGDRFGQFMESEEKLSQTGLRMMRVVTVGKVEDVPVQWVHILLSNDAGRHLSFAYTMGLASSESFIGHDLQMAGSLEFTLKQLPTAPPEEKEGAKKETEKQTPNTASQPAPKSQRQ